jgi:undecaprenyl diphosphate synthase
MSLKSEIRTENLPQHVAIIMDGNGRWAKQQGKLRIFGHKNGVNAVREATEAAAEIGIKYLTLFAFSTENWNRPKAEVDALMDLLVSALKKELPTLNKNRIKLNAFGNLDLLTPGCRKNLMEAIDQTKHNDHMTLSLALSYSAKWEILEAVKHIANQVKHGEISSEQIDEHMFNQAMCTYPLPHPELMIRTSGEHRISNFLLWQLAYAELYFTPVLWPDFTKESFFQAILDYQKRERRFGLTSEQLS